MKSPFNKGTSVADAPEPLSPEEAKAKDREEMMCVIAMESYEKDAAEINRYIADLNNRLCAFMLYLSSTN